MHTVSWSRGIAVDRDSFGLTQVCRREDYYSTHTLLGVCSGNSGLYFSEALWNNLWSHRKIKVGGTLKLYRFSRRFRTKHIEGENMNVVCFFNYQTGQNNAQFFGTKWLPLTIYYKRQTNGQAVILYDNDETYEWHLSLGALSESLRVVRIGFEIASRDNNDDLKMIASLR